jgi:predicted Zn finger-like uncharacterized protein
MYTQCPHCDAVFRVTTAELTASDGNVRCGECRQIFNGMDSLSVLPPEGVTPVEPGFGGIIVPPPAAAPPAAPEAVETAETVDIAEMVEAVDTAEPVEGAETVETVDTAETVETPATARGSAGEESVTEAAPAPDEAQSSRAAPASNAPEANAGVPPGVPWAIQDEVNSPPPVRGLRHLAGTFSLGVLSLLLIGLLGGQVIYHERDRLVAYPELAPLLQWMCGHMDCTLPPRRVPDAFRLSSRNIYSHPNAAGALMIQATLVNQAGFAQPHPLVELSFRNLQGQLLAVRRFSPGEYLPRDAHREQGSVAPGETVHLSLEIEDPGPHAVAYEFRFL